LFDRSWYGRVLVERVEGVATTKEWRRAYREINEFGRMIPADNKAYGRIAALGILIDRLGKDVSMEPRPIDPGLLKEAKRALHLSASDIRRASQAGKRKVKLKRNLR
jgi:hypothetical protein